MQSMEVRRLISGKALCLMAVWCCFVVQAMSCGQCSRQLENAGLRTVLVMPAGTLRAAGNLQRGQQPTLEAMLAAHVSDVQRTCKPEQARVALALRCLL